MRADIRSVDQLFQTPATLRAPLFQRRYVWEEEAHLNPFWADIRRRARLQLADASDAAPHFLGAILLQWGPEADELRIIDGQQRLVTLTLTLAAIRRAAEAKGLDDVVASMERRLWRDRPGGRRRVEATEADAAHLAAIVRDGAPAALRAIWPDRFADDRARLLKSAGQADCLSAYLSLLGRIAAFIDGDDADAATEPEVAMASPAARLAALGNGLLADIRVVAIELEADEDGPAIFEALNDRGAPLDASDLVRNDIVRRSRAAGEDAARLIAEFWAPYARDPFWRSDEQMGRTRAPRIDNLLRCHLVAASGDLVSPNRIFHAHRTFVTGQPRPFPSVRAELESLAAAAKAYREFAEACGDAPLQRLGRRLAPWAPSALVPPILAIAGHAMATADAKARAYDLLAGFLVRRTICGLSRKNLHRVAAGICRALARAESDIDAALLRHLALQSGPDARWPNDHRFAIGWTEAPIFDRDGAQRALALLVELEAAESGRDAAAILAERPQVDHVMPQDWSGPGRARWPDPPAAASGALDDAFRRREQAIASIGNLALIEPNLNAKLGNAGFADRRPIYARSRYLTTKGLARRDDWDEDAILKRAQAWLPTATRLWPGP